MSIQTVEDLRNFMAQELERLRDKESTPAAANAAANIAGKMMSSVKMELEYHKMVGVTPAIPFLKKWETKKLANPEAPINEEQPMAIQMNLENK